MGEGKENDDDEEEEREGEDEIDSNDPDSMNSSSASSSIRSSSAEHTTGISKIRILEIRAETMAKAFAEEICGDDFRMPVEFR